MIYEKMSSLLMSYLRSAQKNLSAQDPSDEPEEIIIWHLQRKLIQGKRKKNEQTSLKPIYC